MDQSLLALLEDVEEPQQQADDANAAEDDDEFDEELEAELEAEVDLNDDDQDAGGEDEEGGATHEQQEAPPATPSYRTPVATPARSVMSEQQSDDNKIGEDDIDVDDEMTADEDDQPVSQLGSLAGQQDVSLPEEMLKRKEAQYEDPNAIKQEDLEAMLDRRTKRESRIVEHFDNIQMERYERFKRSKLKPAAMKKLVETVVGKAVNPNVLTALCGVTKMYIGEVVETARILANRGGHFGALMPIHIHEAYQVMHAENRVAGAKRYKNLFR